MVSIKHVDLNDYTTFVSFEQNQTSVCIPANNNNNLCLEQSKIFYNVDVIESCRKYFPLIKIIINRHHPPFLE